MIGRRTLLAGLSCQYLYLASGQAFAKQQAVSATCMTEVFGNGERLTAVALEYDGDVATESLSPEMFSVENRSITSVYANTAAAKAGTGVNGPFVILELSPEDPAAALYKIDKPKNGGAGTGKKAMTGPPPGGMPKIIRVPAAANVKQLAPILAADGSTIPAMSGAMASSAVKRLVVDDFVQREFKSTTSGFVLKYNLFVPKSYDPAKSYPLVNFMHDAGATSELTDTTLVQGLGAISFADPVAQARQECFVLAPQFSRVVVNDKSEYTEELDMVIALIEQLAMEYSIDQNRLYTTGQSGGGMMSIAMNIKYPDFFAASFLVACQWDATVVAPLAKKKLWIVVSEGDAKAFPGQNAITHAIEQQGTKVSRAVWDGTYNALQFDFAVHDLESEGNPIKYVALRKGTVVPPDQEEGPGANHTNTWRIAYTISGIRDWLLRQSKN